MNLIKKIGNSSPVACSYLYNKFSRKTTIAPCNPLERGSTYTVELTTGLKNLEGGSLKSNYAFSFSTIGHPTINLFLTNPGGSTSGNIKKVNLQFSEPMSQASEWLVLLPCNYSLLVSVFPACPESLFFPVLSKKDSGQAGKTDDEAEVRNYTVSALEWHTGSEFLQISTSLPGETYRLEIILEKFHSASSDSAPIYENGTLLMVNI